MKVWTPSDEGARRRWRSWLAQLFPNLRDAGLRWNEDDAASMAASVAYYLALSLFPLVVLLLSGLGMFLKFSRLGRDAHEQLMALISQQTSSAFEYSFRQVIEQLESHSVITGPSGLVAAIMAAIAVFAQLDRGFDRIWRTPRRRDTSLTGSVAGLARHRVTAFMMLVSLGATIALLFVAELIFHQALQIVDNLLPDAFGTLNLIKYVFPPLANTILFALIYKSIPKRPVPLIYALRGGLLAAVVWEAGRHLLGAFLIGMRYTAAYGVLGSFIAVLLWCYWAMCILFFGAEYVQVLQARAERVRLAELELAAAATDQSSPASGPPPATGIRPRRAA